jgi:hypothetical protein
LGQLQFGAPRDRLLERDAESWLETFGLRFKHPEQQDGARRALRQIERDKISMPKTSCCLGRFSRLDTIACAVVGDLNLHAKSLMLLGSIPSPKQNPSDPLRLLGFFINLVAGTGFEPVTFRL